VILLGGVPVDDDEECDDGYIELLKFVSSASGGVGRLWDGEWGGGA
jgi:hypothetical protein